MGWTIDLPPTPAAEFDAALDAAPVRTVPLGSVDIYERTPDGTWLEPRHGEPGTLRPEIAEQIAAAVEKAKAKVAKLGTAASASLHGHVPHPELEHDEDEHVTVVVQDHPDEVVEANAAHVAEKEATP
jgi:hypothetical protein